MHRCCCVSSVTSAYLSIRLHERTRLPVAELLWQFILMTDSEVLRIALKFWLQLDKNNGQFWARSFVLWNAPVIFVLSVYAPVPNITPPVFLTPWVWQATAPSFWKLSALSCIALSSLNCVRVSFRWYDCACFCISVCAYASTSVYASVCASGSPRVLLSFRSWALFHSQHPYQRDSPVWEKREGWRNVVAGVSSGCQGGSSSASVWPRPDQQLSAVAMQAKRRDSGEILQPLQDGEPVYWGGLCMWNIQG
jgi:hypothetical protein